MGCSSVGDLYPHPDGDDVWTCRMTPSELGQKFMDYDYLLIARADKKFKDRFLPQFGSDNVKDGNLFQILKKLAMLNLIKFR